MADIRAGVASLSVHPDVACRRLASRLARILAGQDVLQALGDGVPLNWQLATDRDNCRNAELRRWYDLRFAGQSCRSAGDAMARLWRRYPSSQQAATDADLETVPAAYADTDKEHLFALGKIGTEPLSGDRIRKIISSLPGLPTPLSVPQTNCDSPIVIETENGNAAHARLAQG